MRTGPGVGGNVHTFTVTVESEDDPETIEYAIHEAVNWSSYPGTVVWVHSRFPSGMMAYPKRDGS